jgi:hypothetical protein
MAFLGQRAIEPIAARTGFRDQDEMRTFRLQLPEEVIAITLAGINGAQGDARGVVVLGDRGDRQRIFLDIQTDGACARLVPG